MNQNKPFMTYEQQITMLKDDKKLEIVDENYAMSLLKEHSYFALARTISLQLLLF